MEEVGCGGAGGCWRAKRGNQEAAQVGWLSRRVKSLDGVASGRLSGSGVSRWFIAGRIEAA